MTNLTLKNNRIYITFPNNDMVTLVRMEHCFDSGQSWTADASLEDLKANEAYYQWDEAWLNGKHYSQSKYGFLAGDIEPHEDLEAAEERWFEETFDLDFQVMQAIEFWRADEEGRCPEVWEQCRKPVCCVP